jgi:ABC-2 type transport system permease protein
VRWHTTIGLVARREFEERLRSRAFQISTAITVVIILAIVIVPTFIDSEDGREYSLGVVGETPQQLDEVLSATSGESVSFELERFADAETAETAVVDGEIDAVLVESSELVYGEDADQLLITIVESAVGAIELSEEAEALGLSSEDILDLIAGTDLETRPAVPGDEADEADLGAAFVGTFLMFIAITTYGAWVLIGVVEEKTSRVVEVVLGTMRPRQLLGGKILGIGVLGLGQLAAIAVSVLAASVLIQDVELPDATSSAIFAVFMWFILGYSFYATAYAAAGSLVSRQEDAQNVAFPMAIFLVVGYLAVSLGAGDGNEVGPVAEVMSFLPPFAPVIMPFRMAVGDVATWEVALAALITAASTYGMVLLAGRIYEVGLLRGGRTKLRDAWRAANS